MDVKTELLKIRESGSGIIIIGAGISGLETAKFCLRNKIQFIVVEKESQENYFKKSKYAQEIKLLISDGSAFHFGIDGERVVDKLGGVRLAILSPGVPLESAICAALRRNSVPFISELEFAVALQNMPAIVVTGSNGKSTTVSLINDILKRAGLDPILCGNVGLPVISTAPDFDSINQEIKKGILVVEASSYQLEICSFLKPKVAVLLNISENHLERHGDINRYLKIKAKIFENQDSGDFAVLGADDPKVAGLKYEIAARLQAFGEKAESKETFSNYAHIKYQPEISSDKIEISGYVYETSKSKLKGRHNRSNIAAAALAALSLGIEKEVIQESINQFNPLEHRFEYVGTHKGFTFINDSKSTTVAASLAALSTALDEHRNNRITLMLGGLSKAGSWEPLCLKIKENSSSLNPIICFGKDSGIIANYCKNSKVPFLIAGKLASAVIEAVKVSTTGDLLLFSPGSASFDEFADFEERGREFKRLIGDLL